jgi:F0F1-type ATP synthase assembly protein I
MKKHNIQNASPFATKQLGDKLNKVIEKAELTFEEKQEQREKDFYKETYIQGIFLGVIIGALMLAIFSSILEKL